MPGIVINQQPVKRTKDLADAGELMELFGMEPGDTLLETIQVCDGYWIKEKPSLYRFYKFEEDE